MPRGKPSSAAQNPSSDAPRLSQLAWTTAFVGADRSKDSLVTTAPSAKPASCWLSVNSTEAGAEAICPAERKSATGWLDVRSISFVSGFILPWTTAPADNARMAVRTATDSRLKALKVRLKGSEPNICRMTNRKMTPNTVIERTMPAQLGDKLSCGRSASVVELSSIVCPHKALF